MSTQYPGPEIIEDPSDVTVTSPETLTLNCTARNNHDAPSSLSFYWTLNGRPLENTATSTIELNGTTVTNQLLVTYNVSAMKKDTYQCIASNRELKDGTQSSLAIITICK